MTHRLRLPYGSAVALVVLTAIAVPADGQQTGNRPPPEETEVWEPVPPTIQPVPNTRSALPPSDAIVLFDGANAGAWINVRDRGAAAWTVSNGVMTVNKETGDIETRRRFRDFQMHIEWRVPEQRAGRPGPLS